MIKANQSHPKPTAPSEIAVSSRSFSCSLLSYSTRSSWLKQVWAAKNEVTVRVQFSFSVSNCALVASSSDQVQLVEAGVGCSTEERENQQITSITQTRSSWLKQVWAAQVGRRCTPLHQLNWYKASTQSLHKFAATAAAAQRRVSYSRNAAQRTRGQADGGAEGLVYGEALGAVHALQRGKAAQRHLGRALQSKGFQWLLLQPQIGGDTVQNRCVLASSTRPAAPWTQWRRRPGSVKSLPHNKPSDTACPHPGCCTAPACPFTLYPNSFGQHIKASRTVTNCTSCASSCLSISRTTSQK